MEIFFYLFLNIYTYDQYRGGENKKAEKIQRFSQDDMAEKLHISQSAYARIESGESSSWIHHLEKLSEIFDMKPEKFLTDEANNLEQENTDQKGGMAFQFVGTINTINSLSEKVIELYEERIKELKEQVEFWKDRAGNTGNSIH